MLRAMNKDQAYFIALLAQVARVQRDKLLGNVAENDLGGTKSSRGAHNPTALLGFEPLPADSEQLTALREAISALAPEGRAELDVFLFAQGPIVFDGRRNCADGGVGFAPIAKQTTTSRNRNE